MDLEVRHLELIRAIDLTGGLTRAAESLHLTQPAASHRLREAEERLGVPLFRRHGRKLLQTDAGIRVLETARRVLDELSAGQSEARRLSGAQRERLRISTGCYTCYHWLGPVLEQFSRAYPTVDVDVVVEATRHPIPFLLDGKLDLAIVSDRVRDRRIAYDDLFTDEFMAIVPREHRFAKRAFLQARDFEGENLVLYSAPLEDLDFLQKFLRPARVTPGRISQVQLTEAVLALVRGGVGIAALARWTVEPHLKALRLAAVRLTRGGMQRHWVAGRRAGEPAPWMRRFVELVAAAGAGLDV